MYDQKTLLFYLQISKLLKLLSPSVILGLNFEKKTVYSKYNFPIQWSAIIIPVRIQQGHLLIRFRMQHVTTAY